jgi:hypothetical protein
MVCELLLRDWLDLLHGDGLTISLVSWREDAGAACEPAPDHSLIVRL